MLEDVLREGFSSLGLSLDEKALARYRLYADELEETNRVMNLTAITGEDEVARLHFLDSAALLTLADFSHKRVIDVGTGAGFPGLALKIAREDLSLVLLDSLDKRVGFLKSCCERLALTDVDCVHLRAEEAPAEYRGGFDIAVSRAVARLNVLCELCMPFVKKGGLFIAMKASDHAEELAEAKRAIALLGGELERDIAYTIPGTDVVHSAILIRKTGDTPGKYPRRWAQIKKQPL
jgi:16S rRNA (guanine527-N7)-methyltransferase